MPEFLPLSRFSQASPCRNKSQQECVRVLASTKLPPFYGGAIELIHSVVTATVRRTGALKWTRLGHRMQQY